MSCSTNCLDTTSVRKTTSEQLSNSIYLISKPVPSLRYIKSSSRICLRIDENLTNKKNKYPKTKKEFNCTYFSLQEEQSMDDKVSIDSKHTHTSSFVYVCVCYFLSDFSHPAAISFPLFVFIIL